MKWMHVSVEADRFFIIAWISFCWAVPGTSFCSFFSASMPAPLPHPAVSLYWKLGAGLGFLCVFQTKETKRVFVKYSCTKLFFKCPSNFLGKTLVAYFENASLFHQFFFFEDLPVFQVNETNLWFLPVNCGCLTFPVDLSSLPIAHQIGNGLGHWIGSFTGIPQQWSIPREQLTLAILQLPSTLLSFDHRTFAISSSSSWISSKGNFSLKFGLFVCFL